MAEMCIRDSLEILENGAQALSRRNRHNGDRLLGLFFRRNARKRAVLFAHIINFDVGKLPQAQGILQRLAGDVGVHMHLHKLRIAHYNQTVANAQELFPQLVDGLFGDVFVHMLDEEFRAVAKFDIGRADIILGRSRGDLLLGDAQIQFGGDLLSIDGHFKALIDHDQPCAAGVDHTRFFQDGQKLRRLFERFGARLDHRIDEGQQVCPAVYLFARLLGHALGNRQDRALLGLHHGCLLYTSRCV